MGCMEGGKAWLCEGWWYGNPISVDYCTINTVEVIPELMLVSELRWKLMAMIRHAAFNGGEE